MGLSDSLPVSLTVDERSDEWRISLVPTSVAPKEETLRSRTLIRRLCQLDGIVARDLKRGRKVRRSVRKLLSPDQLHRRPDGVFASEDLLRPLLLPERVEDSLYHYQRRGVAWLLRHRRALLADDMGLGKTAQALCAVRRLIRRGRVGWGMVVAPRTLMANWIVEATRWAPELCVLALKETGAKRSSAWRRSVGRSHLIVTSYEQLRDPPQALLHQPPDIVIADEAHRLRRRESQSTQGFRLLESRWLWALTGTPVERDAEDLAVLMSILDSRRFSPADKDLHPTALRARARPYMLRRSKDDVLSDLPAVVETEEELELTDSQAEAYREAIKSHARRGAASSYLALFGELRSLCDVDARTGESAKLDRILDILEDIAGKGEKAVVFSYLLEPLRELARRLVAGGDVGHVVLTGDMSLGEREAAISSFKSDQQCNVLLASTRVASEGLTLVEANHVLFVNRWWNPSSNAQARDRVVRIGQERRVWVWSFVCRGTIETRLRGILEAKEETFDDLVEAMRRSESRAVLDELFSAEDV